MKGIKKYINETDQKRIIKFSSKGIESKLFLKENNNNKIKEVEIKDLSDVYGDKEYNISIKEIKDVLNSQKIYLNKIIPKKFYLEFKKAMLDDDIVVLPVNKDYVPLKFCEFESENCKNLVENVIKAPEEYGFKSKEEMEELFNLSVYQIGAMIIKTEDYYIFLDDDGKIKERKVGDNDSIQLINACGIRNFKHMKKEEEIKINKKIITETFSMSLKISKNGIIIIPAVGMGN
jgi:hypothetical protein